MQRVAENLGGIALTPLHVDRNDPASVQEAVALYIETSQLIPREALTRSARNYAERVIVCGGSVVLLQAAGTPDNTMPQNVLNFHQAFNDLKVPGSR